MSLMMETEKEFNNLILPPNKKICEVIKVKEGNAKSATSPIVFILKPKSKKEEMTTIETTSKIVVKHFKCKFKKKGILHVHPNSIVFSYKSLSFSKRVIFFPFHQQKVFKIFKQHSFSLDELTLSTHPTRVETLIFKRRNKDYLVNLAKK